jgi:hypothetical protein
MFHEFSSPLPVTTPLGDGYAIYVRDGGTWENDIWCIALEAGGEIKHFRSDQIRMHANGTFDISKDLSGALERINAKYKNTLQMLAESEKLDGIQKE